jgi:hypothetical protein
MYCIYGAKMWMILQHFHFPLWAGTLHRSWIQDFGTNMNLSLLERY